MPAFMPQPRKELVRFDEFEIDSTSVNCVAGAPGKTSAAAVQTLLLYQSSRRVLTRNQIEQEIGEIRFMWISPAG
jgi:hypothetical protein